ncbi:MAG: hypothetical protein R2684_05240 [Pyrinomonadaceae bacterium]
MEHTRNGILKQVSKLMDDQKAAYDVLQAATKDLSVALVQGDLASIESHRRRGETELTRMRARLVEVMTALTRFAERTAGEQEKLEADIKTEFEVSAKALIVQAKEYQRMAKQAANLAVGGSSFAAACITNAGVPASTYNKPILKKAGADNQWA